MIFLAGSSCWPPGGGTQYALGSQEIIGLALATVAAGAGFGVTKLRVAEPMPPLHVFGNGNFSLSMTMTFLTGREAASQHPQLVS
jgi:hypothetical protein